MPRVAFTQRLVLDAHYLKWLHSLKSQDSLNYRAVVKSLLHINTSSEHHRRSHNVISEKELGEAVRMGLYDRDSLRGIVAPIGIPDSLKDDSRVEETIKMAVYLSDDHPYRVVILTSPEMTDTYAKSATFASNGKAVEVCSGLESLEVVKRLFREYEYGHDTQRQ